MTRRTGAALGLLLLATAAVYLPSIDGAFVYDDEDMASSAWVRDLGAFAHPSTWWTLARPVTSFTFALNHAAVGLDTRGWHLTNVSIHLGAVVLAFAVARRILARAGLSAPGWPALAAAAIFALHPLQTEAVSYLSQRAESLATALWLAGLLLLLAADEAAPPRRARLAGGAIAVHLLALGAKPVAATMPAAWLLAAAVLPAPGEASDPPGRRLARRLPWAAPLLALSVAAALRGIASAEGSGHAGFDVPGVPLDAYLATQLRAVPAYLVALAWPAGQTVDPSFPLSRTLLDPGVPSGGAALAVLAALALWAARRLAGAPGDAAAAGRAAALCALAFLLVLAPTALVPLRDPWVEHRAYLATLLVAVAVAAGAAAALRRALPERAAVAGAALALALLAVLAAASALRNRVWVDELSLWTDAVAKTPEKGRPRAHLALAHHRAGRLDDAIREYDRALALRDPSAPDGLTIRNLTLALLKQGRLDAARARLHDYLARAPEPEVIATLGKVELEAGRLAAAEALAQDALRRDPGAPRGHALLGEVRERRGDPDGAAAALAEAARLDPGDPAPLFTLGRVEERRGRAAEACRAYAAAAALPFGAASTQRAKAALARLRCPR